MTNVFSSGVLNVDNISVDINSVQALYQRGEATPRQLLHALLEKNRRVMEHDENPIWIYLISSDELDAYLDQLELMNSDLPLYGIPFAIKDNIDLAGVPTTAACAQFAYTPTESATVVQKLMDAGAIPLGKTNLDQFATGLVGVRSPYGACKNALNPQYISGGSSSGSAVAVAKHGVSFSLGTDTAGSGRIPASLNNLVGLKPTRGILSCAGVVPACRTLDCVSLFTVNLEDANRVFDCAFGFDAKDPYSRENSFANGKRYGGALSLPLVVGIPKAEHLNFFGDDESKELFDQVIASLNDCGVVTKEINFQPFLDAARLLYEGPWVTERYLACKNILDSDADAVLSVTRTIIEAGKQGDAASVFTSQYKLQQLKQQADQILAQVDCVITPTNGTEYTIEEVQHDPIQLNSNLGYYTNFMNLLDCAALAVPVRSKKNSVGFGVTLFHQAFSDKKLLGIARSLETILGSGSRGQSNLLAAKEWVDIVVCGAHLNGLPLNWQLTERGAEFKYSTTTAKKYQLIAIDGGAVPRPGLIRVDEDGFSFEVEVWRMPVTEFGSFVVFIPQPLAIGKVELQNGDWLPGFVCESVALNSGKNISNFSGWREYLEAVS